MIGDTEVRGRIQEVEDRISKIERALERLKLLHRCDGMNCAICWAVKELAR